LKTLYNLLVFIFFSIATTAQTAIVRGIVLDENKTPISEAEVYTKNNKGSTSDQNGVYAIEVPANQPITITFQSIGLKKVQLTITLKSNQDFEFNPILKVAIEQLGTVIIQSASKATIEGLVSVDPKTIRSLPSASAGVEALLKTLPGVSNNNELSTQYNVRGGNFDENLVYVNEIEVYRPFLIRSGQQEGLSFVNTDLVKNVNFSAGGFQAKYGDKLSSVLDVTYKQPKKYNANAELSLLGGSLSFGGLSKNAKTSAIIGTRYRDNSFLVDARDTESNFRQSFTDIQAYITHAFSSKFELSFLGNIATNLYEFEPTTRQTNFGTLDSPQALNVVFNGQERDRYRTFFGALKGAFKPTKNVSLRFFSSLYHTQEQEYFDIVSSYLVGRVSNGVGSDSFGEIDSIDGVGSQIAHARNDLDALIFNIQHKGTYTKNTNQFDWGVRYTKEDIRDRVREFEFIDNSGNFVSPNLPELNDPTPRNPFDDRVDQRIIPFNNVRATNKVVINRISGFGQWSKQTFIKDHKIWINTGIRAQLWNVSGLGNTQKLDSENQVTISPRGQFAIQPAWKKDMLFRLSTGLYHQPPFYRELRNLNGEVVPDVAAQQSFHISLSNDYSFKMWERPFKLTSEIYYKNLTNVNTYTVENVRIRYRANNNATAFAQGLDLRINGEFVPGTESWFSLGYLKTEENQDNRGFIARPTDQRLKVGVLFQDYVKKIPNLKAYINLVYQTGLPGGSPTGADPYQFQQRLRDYRRADIGTFYELVSANKKAKTLSFLNHFQSFEIGFEIFNIFDFKNAATNTFVRDANSGDQFAIPNFLTPRLLNIKLRLGL